VFDESPVDRLQAVQRRFGLVDLDFRRGKAAGARPLLQPTPISRVLELAREWLLLPRNGSASELDLYPSQLSLGAIVFTAEERQMLGEYLCGRENDADAILPDLYTLSAGGDVMVTLNRDPEEHRINVQLQSISDGAGLLVSLNQLGAELELYYN
jgi:hypothetical protein